MNNQVQNISSIMKNSSSTTGNTTMHTEPGVSESDLHQISAVYSMVLGDMQISVAWYIEDLIKNGMNAEVIIHALKETAWAPQPSPRYFRAICNRLMDSGAKTMEQVKQSANRPKSKFNYMQRDYSEYKDMYSDPTKELR